MTRITSSDDERDVSLLAIDQYMRQVRWMEALSRDEEAALFEQVARGKRERREDCPRQWVLEQAQQARDRLVEGFQPLVIHFAKRYHHRVQSLDLLDLVQEGNLGLLKAIDLNECGAGGFSGLAARCIAFAVYSVLPRCDCALHYSDEFLKSLRKVRQAQRRLTYTLDREPTVHEVAWEMGVSEFEVWELKTWWSRREAFSLQQLAEGEEHTQEDRLCFQPLYVSQGDDRDVDRQQWQSVHQACETALTDRQRAVIEVLYGLGGCPRHTYHEAARVFEVTPSAIRSMEQTALKRLRGAFFPVQRTQRKAHEGMYQDYYTAAQAASALGLSLERFKRVAASGAIPRYTLAETGERGCSGHTRYLYSKIEIGALAEEKRKTFRWIVAGVGYQVERVVADREEWSA
jgi:RNA polymerase primary sigma factor